MALGTFYAQKKKFLPIFKDSNSSDNFADMVKHVYSAQFIRVYRFIW